MNMIEFNERFSTEEQCRQHLFEQRWGNGFVCPKCGHTEHFNIKSRHLYQCKACNHQASATAGTIMDKSRTPLTKWFLALYLIAEDKRGMSALALSKRIGVAYNTAWTMCHKIRHAMGAREGGYRMEGVVEMDEAFFGSPAEGGKRGRGTDKTAVLVSVSLSDDGKPRFAKMSVLDAVDGETISGFAEKAVAAGSEIHTDGLNVYAPLAKKGYVLVQKNYDPKNQPEHLHWTHILISNAKAFVDGTYHGLDKVHLQRYLDEFCFRFNRRFRDTGYVFARLLNSCICRGKITGYELIGQPCLFMRHYDVFCSKTLGISIFISA
jgi:transposase-like protein